MKNITDNKILSETTPSKTAEMELDMGTTIAAIIGSVTTAVVAIIAAVRRRRKRRQEEEKCKNG